MAEFGGLVQHRLPRLFSPFLLAPRRRQQRRDRRARDESHRAEQQWIAFEFLHQLPAGTLGLIPRPTGIFGIFAGALERGAPGVADRSDGAAYRPRRLMDPTTAAFCAVRLDRSLAGAPKDPVPCGLDPLVMRNSVPKLPLYLGNLAGDLRKPLLVTHQRRSQ